MTETADASYMRRALNLAEKGRGWTSPNPMVGAVIVKGRKVVGEGYHRRVGEDHAERVAIKKAGVKAKGATLYVNLEPCCHTGRTGPCTEAIIEAGISKVVFSVRDPDPRVNGKGARILRKAGVTVESGLMRKQALQLNESYFAYYKNKRPFVILKTAQTLDGRIASVTGDSRWISGSQSLKLVHQLRTEVDAVVVGMGTVRKDNPALTVRLVKGKNPYRIILSQSLKFPRQCRLLDHNSDHKTIVATTPRALQQFSRTSKGRRQGLIYWNVRTNRDDLLDLHDFVTKAGEFGLRSLLVEGGGGVATSFLKAGLVDKYVIVMAPLILGSGVSAVGEIHTRKLADAISFDRYWFQRSGTDNVFVGYPRKRV